MFLNVPSHACALHMLLAALQQNQYRIERINQCRSHVSHSSSISMRCPLVHQPTTNHHHQHNRNQILSLKKNNLSSPLNNYSRCVALIRAALPSPSSCPRSSATVDAVPSDPRRQTKGFETVLHLQPTTAVHLPHVQLRGRRTESVAQQPQLVVYMAGGDAKQL